MDNAQWPQEEIVPIIGNTTRGERKGIRFEKDQVLNCPRCNSANTKFCYYNNYSLSQPRHFCKACRRYWTAGGSLRNIPVGGGPRKKKKMKPSSSSLKKVADDDLVPPVSVSADHHHQDLNLGAQLSSTFMPPSILPISDPNLLYSSGISLPGSKQCLKICLDGIGNHHHHHRQAMQDGTNNSSDDGAEQDRDWNNNGVLRGGGAESW